MKIAVLAPLVAPLKEPYPSGIELSITELVGELVKKKHSVTVFAAQGSSIKGAKSCKTKVCALKVNWFADLQGVAAESYDRQMRMEHEHYQKLLLELHARQKEFDLIHNLAFHWLSFFTLHFFETPVLHSLRGPPNLKWQNATVALLPKNKKCYICTISQAMQTEWAHSIPIDKIICNGLDIDSIPFTASPKGDYLVWFGRIIPEKGLEQAIAIARATKQKLVVMGDIYDVDYFNAKIKPLLRYVDFRGYTPRKELFRVVGNAKAFIYPSHFVEGFGRVLVESMACGTPVVAYNVGSVPEIVVHGKTGYVVQLNAMETFIKKLGQVHRIARLSCRKHVQEHFALENMTSAYLAYYQYIIKNARK